MACLNPASLSPLVQLLILSFGGSLGLLMIFLACALPQHGVWWPFFVLVFYFFAPLPTMFAQRFSPTMYTVDGPQNNALLWAIFFTMGPLVSSFAFPFVLARISAIRYSAACLTCAGSVLFYVTLVLFFLIYFHEEY